MCEGDDRTELIYITILAGMTCETRRTFSSFELAGVRRIVLLCL